MIFNNSVTLYHDNGNRFVRRYFVRACVFFEEKIDASGGGQVRNDSVLVRIFTHDMPDIEPGDRFVLGYSEAAVPPENSHLILGVTRNCRGTGRMHHYKIQAV